MNLHKEAGLCGSCLTLDLKAADFQEIKSKTPSQGGIILKQTLQALKESTYCSLCRLIVHAVEDTRAEWQKAEKLADEDITCQLRAIPYRFPTPKTFKVLDVTTNFPFFGSSYGIQLLPVESDDSDDQLIGRIIDPSRISIRLVQNWLMKCVVDHGDSCTSSKTLRFKEIESILRVIDVEQGCIVSPTDEFRYIALSYVWGQTKSVTLVKGNLDRLQKPDGITNIFKDLSLVIQNAIELTRALGEKYIWIDSLCIIQDDWDIKSKIIHKMNLVYENAFLTIIAASGTDANTGLPGVGYTTRSFEQATATVNKDLKFIYPPPHAGLSASVWASRGWTYQEYYFSKRRLIFHKGLIFFRCRKRSWREDIALERFGADISQFNIGLGFEAQTELWEPLQANDMGFWDLRGSYHNSIRAYMRRNLSIESDAFNAFAGIIDHMRVDRHFDTFWGLSVSTFGLDIFWQPRRLMKRRDGFPSWSWLGWKGPMWMGRTGGVNTDEQQQSLSSWIWWFRIERAANAIRYLPIPKGRDVPKGIQNVAKRDDSKEKEDSKNARQILRIMASAWSQLVIEGKGRDDYHRSKIVEEGLRSLSNFSLPRFLHSKKGSAVWSLDDSLKPKSLFFRTICADVWISVCAPNGEIPQEVETIRQAHKAGSRASYIYSTREPNLEPLGIAWINDTKTWEDLLARSTSVAPRRIQQTMEKEPYMPVSFVGDPQKFIFRRAAESSSSPQPEQPTDATYQNRMGEIMASLKRLGEKPSETLSALPNNLDERNEILKARQVLKTKFALLSGPVEGNHDSRVGVPFSYPFTTFRGFFRIMLLQDLDIRRPGGESFVVTERSGIGELELNALDKLDELKIEDIVLV